MRTDKTNILVTGMPRSGTTFVGKALTFSPEVAYLWEPFNSRFRRGVRQHYPYVGRSSNHDKVSFYARLIEDTAAFRNLKPCCTKYLFKPGQLRLLSGIDREWEQVRSANAVEEKPFSVFKDPIAIFLSEIMITRFDFKIVFVVRHPAALYAAWERLGWLHDFRPWIEQPDFVADHFGEFAGMIDSCPRDILSYTALQWLVSYSYMEKIKLQYPENVMVVRHEDLCVNAKKGFAEIFRFAGIGFTNEIASRLADITEGSGVNQVSRNFSQLEKRDSVKLSVKWKDQVSREQLERIMEITALLSEQLYPEPLFRTI